MIRIKNWERHQHYKRPKPAWIKVYRDLLNDYDFGRLDPTNKWILIGLWLLAAETDNNIPQDKTWLKNRLQLPTQPDLDALQTLGFITLGEPSREALEKVYTQTEERRGEGEAVGKPTDENVDVDNWNWGDFAGWFRTTGHKLLWQGDEPPEWAAKDGRPWSVKRDLSILSQLRKKGEPLEALKGVIEINTEATCMLHYNQAGRWDYYYREKAEWQKRERTKENHIGAIFQKISQTA